MEEKLTGKKIAVIGLGKTGLAAAEFFVRRGARVVATDEKLPHLDIRLEPSVTLGPYAPSIIEDVDLVVPSPGIPPGNAILVAARERHIPIVSELEMAFRYLRVPVIAVTGTNGKTTTVSLIGHILAHAGKRVFMGGNIGIPLISYVEGQQKDDWVVVEASSFQLMWTEVFRPFIGVLLNVTQDHLDYHGSMEAYRQAKERLFEKQRETDVAVLNGDDEETEKLKRRIRSRAVTFSTQWKVSPPGIYLAGDEIIYRPDHRVIETYPRSSLTIPGLHNAENCMAAIVCTRLCGCERERIVEALGTFRGIPHRIEVVAEIDGVTYVDDSKGTNCDAVKRALETFSQPVILLMGGRDKDSDFSPLRPILSHKVKHLVIFGEARDRISGMVQGAVEMTSTPTLREGVKVAKGMAVRGDVVLLSPGCASFDEFSDYQERGRMFRKWIAEEENVEVA